MLGRSLDANRKTPMLVPDGAGGAVEVEQLVHLNQVIDHPRMQIGDFTYYHHFGKLDDYAGQIAPYLFPLSPETVRIGKFCQLAHGVRFITSSANHQMHAVSTYPFDNFMMDASTPPEEMASLFSIQGGKGDSIVGNDVWIGFEAVVMPGVTIGDGAIVGARSVVTHDVAPYSVVAGSPARLIRHRFDETTKRALVDLAWWNWDVDKIEANLDAIRGSEVDGLLSLSN